MKTRVAAIALALVALAAMPQPALAAKSTTTSYDATSASLRDAAGDVLRSDGDSAYVGNDALSTRITDFADPATADRFQFQPWRSRRAQIQSPSINEGQAVTCEFTWVVFTTRSTERANWYEQLTSGTQPSVNSDAFFHCHPDNAGPAHRWVIAYPDGADECAQIELVDAATDLWRFSAPAYNVDTDTGCPATLATFVKEGGKTTRTDQPGVSAPMEITAVIPAG